MTVTYSPIERIDELTFRLVFSSDRPRPVTFRIYDEGVLAETIESETGTGEYIRTVYPGESPYLEVIDRADQIASLAFPSNMTLAWVASEGAQSYRIDELVSAVWTTRGTVTAGPPSFTWLTRRLEDVTTHSFRVIPLDVNSNEGDPLELTALMVRIPDAPDVSITYSSGTQTLTVT